MKTINEGSTYSYTVFPTDPNGVTIPLEDITAIYYSLGNGKGVDIIPRGELTKDVIVIPPEYNTLDEILGEYRNITIEIEYNTADVITQEIFYKLSDLVGIVPAPPT